VTAPAGERQIVSVDLAGARVTARTCAATPPVQSVAFSQDGTRLLASTGDLRLTQFDAASGAALGPLPDGIGPYYEGLTLSPDGRHAGWTQLVPTGPNMWLDTLNLSEMPGGATQTLLRGQPGALVSPQPVFSPDSRLFASVDFFSDLLDVFDVETAALLSEVPLGWAYPTPLGFTADGSAIRLADETSVRTVNWRDGTTLSAWTAGARPSAASADGATVVMDGGSVLRSYREGVLLAEMPTTDDNIYCAETPITRMAPGASVTSFGMQCGRPWDSTTGPLTQIRDTATGALIQSLAIDPSIVFSWDGRRFAAGDTVWCQ
jgi:DNA-binding beta-propeller fold protein YncE